METPYITPTLQWTGTEWSISREWCTWADTTRAAILKVLAETPKWFSKPPRYDTLASIFTPWANSELLCTPPIIPPGSAPGSATWKLDGVLMTSSAITPVWTINSYLEDSTAELISLFNDGVTIDASSSSEEEVAPPPRSRRTPAAAAKRVMAKERVREARLKAQIAERIASKEEARFYRLYGDLTDGESQFSDYDLSSEDEELITTL